MTLFFLAGMIIARGWRARRPSLTVALLNAVAVFTGVLGSVRSGRPDVEAAVTLLAISAVLMSAVWLEARLGRSVPRWVMVGGASSYALYLVHPLLAPAVPAALAALGVSWVPWLVVVTTTVIAMLGVAPLAHRFVERPLNRAAGRLLFPDRRARSASASRRAATPGGDACARGRHDSDPTDTSVVRI